MKTKINLNTQARGGVRTEVEDLLLDITDIVNGYKSLTYLPINPTEVNLFIIHAPGTLRYGVDFVIEDNLINWSQPHCSEGLTDILSVGDRFIVVYERTIE